MVFRNQKQHLLIFSGGLLSGLAWAFQPAVTTAQAVASEGRSRHQWLGDLEIRGAAEDTRTGMEMSPEGLECKGVWLRTNWSFCKELSSPVAFLPWSLFGGLKNCLGLCYCPAEDICPHPAHRVPSPPPPLCHQLSSSSLWLALLWSLERKWRAVTLSTLEGRNAPESGNFNSGWSLQRRAGVSQREVCCWYLLWRRQRDGQTRMGGQQAIQIPFPPVCSKAWAGVSISGKDVMLPWNSNTPKEVRYCQVNWHL